MNLRFNTEKQVTRGSEAIEQDLNSRANKSHMTRTNYHLIFLLFLPSVARLDVRHIYDY